MSNHVGTDRAASSSFAILAMVSLALTQLAPLTAGSSSPGLPLPPTSDEQVCFSNVNVALGQLPALSPGTRTRFLQVAESSSQYKAFAGAGAAVSLVSTLPAMESRISAECSGVIIEAYTFSFVSGGKELSIAVDPSTMSVLRTLTVRAVNWGVFQNNTGGNWGGGYEYWNGTAGPNNPQYPYWYVEGVWNLPTVTSSCPTTRTYGIWSGLTDVWNGNHLAQTGFGADTSTSGSTYYLWYQFVPVNSTATNCTFTMTPGDHILSATYNDANTSPTGSPSNYNVDTLDSTVGRACQTYHYNWSTGLGANSYFALLAGEVKQTTIPNFGQVTISGIIYDNHYNGGPPGHCISTPYNNGWANSFTIISGVHKATESLDSGNCTFKDDYW